MHTSTVKHPTNKIKRRLTKVENISNIEGTQLMSLIWKEL